MTEKQAKRESFPIEHAYAAVVGYVLGAYIDLVNDEDIQIDWGEREYPSHRKIRGRDAYRPVDANLEDAKHWMTLQIAGFANLSDQRLENNKPLRELARQTVGDDPQQIDKFITEAKQRAERILARNEDFGDYLTTRLLFAYPSDRPLDADEFAERAAAFHVHRQRKASGRSQPIYRGIETALADECGPEIFSITSESRPRRIVISSTTSDEALIQLAIESLSRQGYHATATKGEPTYILAIRKSPADA